MTSRTRGPKVPRRRRTAAEVREDKKEDKFWASIIGEERRSSQYRQRRDAEHVAHDGTYPVHRRSLLFKGVLWNGSPVRVDMTNGHHVTIEAEDNWLIITADSTMTVRPVNERKIYVRPVGYVGGWVPDFAPGKVNKR